MQHQSSTKVTEFVDATKAKGASDEFLASFLARQGWPEDEVFSALGNYWEKVTGVPVPQRAGRGESSRDAFLYLLSFATLATWASALGSMIFNFIEKWFPDTVAAHAYNLRSTVTWQMASVAVAFPIFLLTMRTIIAEANRQPERLRSGVRKWLTYIALLLTAGGIISDLICFLDYFLMGELTTRFLLKVATVLVICAAIFFYYLRSLQWEKGISMTQAKPFNLAFAWGSLSVVVVAFCIGLGMAGTPSSQRHLQADTKRVQDLRAIASALHVWNLRAVAASDPNLLPTTLDGLLAKGVNNAQILDPETSAPYEYRVIASAKYQLCATFAAASDSRPMMGTATWAHGKGRTCFYLDATAIPSW